MANNGHVVIGIDGDARNFERTLKSLGNITKAGLADIKAGLDMTAAAARGLFEVASSGVKYTANIERLQTSFEVMTGSAEKAAEVVNRLRTMGAETPFETADLAATTQMLMQYGFTADDALEKMRMLGDIAQGNKEAMTSIAMGYAQMSSAGKVNLQDIKQMINGGFNPLQEISERTGESMASLYDRISKGTMSVDEITESMRRATSEGGKFFEGMQKQSQTLNGQLSTLKDNADRLLGSLTEGLANDLRDDLLPLANNMISTLQEAFDKDGMGGLMEAATGMVPDLLNMMTGRIEDSLASLSKFAPKAVSSIMKSIPAAIRSGSNVLPQITAALFDVAGLVVSELVSMLPELVPQVLSGFGNMFNEALKGTFKLITGFYTGIEQAIHQGQTKVMGMWVDNEKIAKYDFSVDLDVDPSNAYQEIETAYSNLRTALSTDLLTDDQRDEIIGMIGQDYDAIYAKLISFGLSEEDAKPIAEAFTTAGAALQTDLLTESQRGEIIGMIGQDYDAIKAKLLSFGLTEEEAKPIAEAFATAGSALQTQLLTSEQRSEILGMIGEDYDAIKAKLLSFGLSDEEAGSIATAVTEVNGKLTNELEKLDLSVPTSTVIGWYREANGSRLHLIAAAKKAGLNDRDIENIAGIYEGMLGRVKNSTPSIVQEIYDKLSDGKPDDTKTVEALKGQIESYISGLLTQLEEAYSAKQGELDSTAADYAERKAALDEWYAASKADITSMDTEMRTLVSTLAGAPTATVQARLEEFAELERRLGELDAEIQAASAKATTDAENAFKVVRSGAKADEQTISLAISFKASQYKVDTQAAEDTYNAAMTELNRLFASGEISKEEFDLKAGENAATLESSKAAAQAAYEQALREIFGGIAESEVTMAAIEEAGANLDLSYALQAAAQALKDKEGLYENALGDEITNILAEHLQMSPELLNSMHAEFVQGELDTWAVSLFTSATDAVKNVESESLASAYQAALQEGVLAGTVFDTTAIDEQFAAILGTSMTEGAALASSDAQTAGASMVSSAGDGAANSGDVGGGLGKDFGQGYINGISSYVATAYARAKSLAQAAERGVKDGQKSASPSKIARGLGGDFGEGYSIGLRESMARAAQVARRMTGGIATAASLTQSMRVNMPDLQQEIMLANEQNPVKLYVNGRELGQVTAEDNSRAQNAYRKSIALGVGK